LFIGKKMGWNTKDSKRAARVIKTAQTSTNSPAAAHPQKLLK
jgi:hypothetical protein